ncbi:DUF998 domain-containing protein [Corynebacterium gerontici]|uniref:Frag1/DRAM/Sfk1 family protein n=1 Tax=Corynebacterium gerontici TaxID=2079234 RepID=A0A3G6J539_9CORY|nr:hypothetical protein [Corynebacterium gerontici]AZA12058.1 hypothetical protein CGERO_08835 [Corynebacterium gerontici]
MKKLRSASMMLFAATILLWLGQIITMFMWDGVYQASTMYISDLGARECQVLSEATMPRVVCSPGHVFYIIGMVSAGFLLLGAATLLRSVGVDRRGAASKRAPIKGVITNAFALALMGIAFVLNGMVDVNDGEVLHQVLFAGGCIALWVLMARNAWAGIKYQPLLNEPSVPLLNKAQSIITLLFLLASIAGYLLFILSPPPSSYGLFQHIAIDSGALWMLMFATVLRTKAKAEL